MNHTPHHYQTNQPTTLEHCPWLTNTIPTGTTLYPCTQNTFNMETPQHAALTHNPDGTYPFYLIPRTHLTAHHQTQAA